MLFIANNGVGTDGDAYFPQPQNFNLTISKLSAGCCDIRLTYNGGFDDSFARAALVVETMAIITSLEPSSQDSLVAALRW